MHRPIPIRFPPVVLAAAASALLCACESAPSTSCVDRGDAFVDCIASFDPHPDSNYNHDRADEVVTGPPRGPLDTMSLGCEGEIVLQFRGMGIPNGPGADFIVFENPFDASFPEPGEVAVSDDGERWYVFPCDPQTLDGCAGVSVTQATERNGGDPTNPGRAGGDAFDLDELPDAPEHVSFVRITDVSRSWWEPQGQDWCDPGQDGKGGFDLDSIAAVHGDPWPG